MHVVQCHSLGFVNRDCPCESQWKLDSDAPSNVSLIVLIGVGQDGNQPASMSIFRSRTCGRMSLQCMQPGKRHGTAGLRNPDQMTLSSPCKAHTFFNAVEMSMSMDAAGLEGTCFVTSTSMNTFANHDNNSTPCGSAPACKALVHG